MHLFRRKSKEEPKRKEEENPKYRGRCPNCGDECDVTDYGIFLGYFCMKCGPTMEMKVGNSKK